MRPQVNGVVRTLDPSLPDSTRLGFSLGAGRALGPIRVDLAYQFVAFLPRTSSGKLRRSEALRQLLAGELRSPDPVTLLHVAKETARSLLARMRG